MQHPSNNGANSSSRNRFSYQADDQFAPHSGTSSSQQMNHPQPASSLGASNGNTTSDARFSWQNAPPPATTSAPPAQNMQPLSPTANVENTPSYHTQHAYAQQQYQQQDPTSPTQGLYQQYGGGQPGQYPLEKINHPLNLQPYTVPPTSTQHPAFTSPYADPNTPIDPPSQQQQQYGSDTLRKQPLPPQTPTSPGPIPLKNEHDIMAKQQDTDSHASRTPRTPHTPYTPYGDLRTSPHLQQSTGPIIAPDHAPTMVSHQPGQISHPNMSYTPGTGTGGGNTQITATTEAEGAWTSSLLSDVPTCCYGTFCGCILYGKTQYRLNARAARRDPTDLLGWSKINGECLIWSFACGLQFIPTALQRWRVRRAYAIPGSVMGDLCTSCCCLCCVLAQDDLEVKTREERRRLAAGPSSGGRVGSFVR